MATGRARGRSVILPLVPTFHYLPQNLEWAQLNEIILSVGLWSDGRTVAFLCSADVWIAGLRSTSMGTMCSCPLSGLSGPRNPEDVFCYHGQAVNRGVDRIDEWPRQEGL
jgi:hypothetical protein